MIPELLKKIDQVPLWNERFYCSPPEATPKGVSLVFGSNAKLYQATAISGPGTEAGPQDPVTSSEYWYPVGRRMFTADTTLYLRKTGNDANDGLSSDTALLTFDGLVARARQYDFSNYSVTIDVGAGTWSEIFYIAAATFLGANKVNINGEAYTTSRVDGIAYNRASYGTNSAPHSSASTVRDISATQGIIVLGTNVTLAGTVEACGVSASGGGYLLTTSVLRCVAAPTTILGTLAALMASDGAWLRLNGSLAVGGAFTCIAHGESQGTIVTNGTAISIISTVTGKRYNAQNGALINTSGGGANYFPGSVAGSLTFGGQYF